MSWNYHDPVDCTGDQAHTYTAASRDAEQDTLSKHLPCSTAMVRTISGEPGTVCIYCRVSVNPPFTQKSQVRGSATRCVPTLFLLVRSTYQVPANESFHHCIRIFPGITFPRTESLIAAVSTLNALMANAAGLFVPRRRVTNSGNCVCSILHRRKGVW